MRHIHSDDAMAATIPRPLTFSLNFHKNKRMCLFLPPSYPSLYTHTVHIYTYMKLTQMTKAAQLFFCFCHRFALCTNKLFCCLMHYVITYQFWKWIFIKFSPNFFLQTFSRFIQTSFYLQTEKTIRLHCFEFSKWNVNENSNEMSNACIHRALPRFTL